LCTGVDGSLQSDGKEADRVAACRLGLVHRDICLLQDLVCAFSFVSENSNPNAGGAEAVMAIEQKWPANGCEDLLPYGLRQCRGILRSFAQIFQDHHKFISTQARHSVSFSNT